LVQSTSTVSEAKPLRGTRIIITRPREQADEFVALLETREAEVIILPTIKIDGPDDWTEVDRAVERWSEYDWLVFTSSNAVKYFCQRLKSDWNRPRPQICAVGPATAEALAAHELRADVVAEHYTAEGVLAAFAEQLDGIRVLFPRGNLAREVVPAGLRQRGATVDDIVVYCTRMADPPNPAILEMIQSSSIDVVTFTSSSTAKNFVHMIGEEKIERLKDRFLVASIGPQTSHTLRELGMNVNIEAPVSTVPALVEAMVAYFDSRR
jgi:uroporphyrinogen III methyltransferase/synthase